jgi:hypothetical protein
MGSFPNKATQFKSGKQQVEQARKGGQAKTFKKKYAAQLREMKKRGMNKDDLEWFEMCMSDPEASIVDIRRDINNLMESVHPAQRVALLNTKISTHKLAYGEKIKTENIHHIINWTESLKNCELKEEDAIRLKKVN